MNISENTRNYLQASYGYNVEVKTILTSDYTFQGAILAATKDCNREAFKVSVEKLDDCFLVEVRCYHYSVPFLYHISLEKN